jgi:NAD(P)-dependent dehydrogenase (short-subunit alcohol dehydrogenase family)
MSKPIALILGSGANLGSRVADRLRSDGYRVATVSRSKATDKDDEEDALTLKADFADPKEVKSVFATVREVWGEPSVVVYNGMKAFAPVASKQESQSIFLSLSLSLHTDH